MPSDQWSRQRVIVVDDTGWLCLAEEPISDQFITAHVDLLVGTGVDTLCWNLGLTGGYRYPTRVDTVYGTGTDRFDSSTAWRFKHNFMAVHEAGRDMLRLALDRGREVGLRVYPALRISDAQMGGDFDPFSRAHPEFRIGCQPAAGYGAARHVANYPEQLDFAHPEVAARPGRIVDELLEMYDLDGLELDFNRRPHFFKPAEAIGNQPIMTALLRQIHARVRAAERRAGHPIELLVRVPGVMEDCHQLGLDVPSWLAEGLMDVLIPGYYMWLGLDLPVEPFVAAARDTETRVLVGLAPRLSGAVGGMFAGRAAWMPDSGVTIEMYRAAMDVYYHRGVNGVEIFNFYTNVRFGARLELDYLQQIGYPGKVRAGTRVYPYMGVESVQRPVTVGMAPTDINLALGEVPAAHATVRLELYVSQLTPLDRLTFSLNGNAVNGRRERALVDHTGGLQPPAPWQGGTSGHKLIFDLHPADLHPGRNVLSVALQEKNPYVSTDVTIEGAFLTIEMPHCP